jgi:hypothetical protein
MTLRTMYLSALDDDEYDAFVSLRKHCAEYFAVETKIQAQTKTGFYGPSAFALRLHVRFGATGVDVQDCCRLSTALVQ